MNNNILLYPILLGGGTNIGPYWFPPPPSAPASASVSCQGPDQLEKNKFLMRFYVSYKKVRKIIDRSFKSNKNLILGDAWNKYWSLLALSPHPHPRRQQKSPARGQTN